MAEYHHQHKTDLAWWVDMRGGHVCVIDSWDSFHLENTAIVQMVEPPTRPGLLRRILHESSLDRILMHVLKLF